MDYGQQLFHLIRFASLSTFFSRRRVPFVGCADISPASGGITSRGRFARIVSFTISEKIISRERCAIILFSAFAPPLPGFEQQLSFPRSRDVAKKGAAVVDYNRQNLYIVPVFHQKRDICGFVNSPLFWTKRREKVFAFLRKKFIKTLAFSLLLWYYT